jgi:T-complex protein 1 subunit beta
MRGWVRAAGVPCRAGAAADVVAWVDMYNGGIGSMKKLGVTESFKLKQQVVISASEAAEMILRWVCSSSCGGVRLTRYLSLACRVDTILRSTPRKREAM